MSNGVTVHLNQFEGPLGLLLFLIRKEEMDIMDINIGQITNQYLAYIKNMGSLDLENAGDFVAMAATLIHIKSKMLLPNYEEEDEEPAQDPRKELVQKLLEYQVYKEASGKLYQRPLLNRETWIKGAKEPLPDVPDDNIEVDDNPLFSLILSYRKLVKRVNKAVHRVASKMQSVASRILEIQEYLQPGGWTSFFEVLDKTRNKPQTKLVETREPNLKGPEQEQEQGGDQIQEQNQDDERAKILITFLALLELGKIGFIKLFQSNNYSDIHVETLESVQKDVISQVEEYENLDQDENTAALFKSENLSLDLTDDNFDDEPADKQNMSAAQTEGKNLSKADSDKEQPAIVDAASDEDIEEEEKKLGLNNLDLGLEG